MSEERRKGKGGEGKRKERKGREKRRKEKEGKEKRRVKEKEGGPAVVQWVKNPTTSAWVRGEPRV